MKKVLNIIFALMLGLSMVACDSMLKDSLAAGSGWGDVLLKSADVTVDSSLSVTVGALDLTSAKLKIDGTEQGTIGTVVKNVLSGPRKIDVEITKTYDDGKFVLTGTKNVNVTANEEVSVGSFSLSSETGYGSLNVTTAGAIIDPSVTKGALDLDVSKASLKIAGTTETFGTKLSDIKAGDVVLHVEVPSLDGKTIYYCDKTVTVVAPNLLTVSNIVLDQAKDGTNAYKFILTETKFNQIKDNDDLRDLAFSNITKVTLRGSMNSWGDETPVYQLYKSGSNWIGYFPINAGESFKFAINDKWSAGDNITVGEIAGVIESAMAWKFTLTETKFNQIKDNDDLRDLAFSNITKVALRGSMNSWGDETPVYQLYKSGSNWIGYFPINEGESFKFAINDKWSAGDNITVGEIAGVITH